jgi:hypothetical protein
MGQVGIMCSIFHGKEMVSEATKQTIFEGKIVENWLVGWLVEPLTLIRCLSTPNIFPKGPEPTNVNGAGPK